MKLFFALTLLLNVFLNHNNLPAETNFVAAAGALKTGAEQTEKYLPYLKGKRVAMLANQTSIIGKRHLVDSLKILGVNIVKVFGPEHGFRGNASAGTAVADEIDGATGIPVISLYGKKNKPTKEELSDVDIIIYDLLKDLQALLYSGNRL